MRRIGLGLAAALVFASSAHAAGWSVYTFADQSFSIESPAPLTKGTSTYKGAIAGVIPTITYTAQLDNIRYKVSVIDISNRIPESVNLFEEMEFLTSLGGKVIGNDSVGIEPGKNRHYGRELVINTKDGNFLRITLVYNKGKIYASEAAVLPNGDKDSLAPERFVGSILFDLEDAKRERDANPDNFSLPDPK
ncbi:MAG TPA: hypothetical protein VK479_03225 [Micropepsaceae bacterium]|nr:hypothetical protein [Micropepsaceae bacterium]